MSKLKIEYKNIDELIPYINNPRLNDGAVDKVASSIKNFGFKNPIIVDKDNEIIAGHTRLKAARKLGLEEVPTIKVDDLTEPQIKAFRIADNKTSEFAEWDMELLEIELEGLDDIFTGFDDWEDLFGEGSAGQPFHNDKNLVERFIAPPFSVLDASQGYWMERKRAWKSLGLQSELGRPDGIFKSMENLQDGSYGVKNIMPNTSVFDPALCEIIYKWFNIPGGKIYDCFAGGSVRGVVAGKLGLPYTGIELRPEQVEANIIQGREIIDKAKADLFSTNITDPHELTPIQEIEGIYIKRDDLFNVLGVAGGKVRTCLKLSQGATGLVTAGSRMSPQVNIVATVAKHLNIPCNVHTPEGELSAEVAAAKVKGANVVQHKAGYNNVIIKRAKDDAIATGYTNIPFGMECQEAIDLTKVQVQNIPEHIKRIVVPVGSGMTLAGILQGLVEYKRNIKVLGISVGADAEDRLNEYAPKNWRSMVEIIKTDYDYHDEAEITNIGQLELDPIYEAKCIDYVEKGDLFWVVGIRETRTPTKEIMPKWICDDSLNVDKYIEDETIDLFFSCPPYADLEVYSDDPRDLSTMEYDEFIKVYKEIIAKGCRKLKPNRFAAFVVGEVRDNKNKGFYYNFLKDTVEAFEEAGVHYYNDIILKTPIGTAMLRADKTFRAGRKVVKTHQNLMVFFKGDPSNIREDFGDIEIMDIEDFIEEEE